MINKRKLDEVIENATYAPEKLCGYTFEQFLTVPMYKEHVCEFVNEAEVPRLLSNYLYEDCYYEDMETVKANLDYINSVMKKIHPTKNWIDISMETILEWIGWLKEENVEMADVDDGDGIDDYDLG